MRYKYFNGYRVYENGKIIGKFGKILKWRTAKGGYQRVAICNDGVCVNYSVHRLVALLFVPNPLNKPEVNHIDNDKKNNDASNLEWVTRRENCLHTPSQKGRTGYLSAQSKRVFNTITGLYYPSIKNAAESIGMKPATLSAKFTIKNRKNETGFVLV